MSAIWSRRRSRLRFRVLLLVGVGVLVPAALLAGVCWTRLGELDDRVLRERRAAAEAVAAHQDAELTADLEDLQRTASSLALDPDRRNPERERELLRRAFMGLRFTGGVFLLDAQGRTLVEEPQRERPLSPPPDLPELAEALRTGKPVVSGLVPDGAGYRVYALVPVASWRGGLAGVVGGLLDPSLPHQAAELRHVVLGRKGTADLVDAEGLVLASTDKRHLRSATTCQPTVTRLIREHRAEAQRCGACHPLESSRDAKGYPGVFTVAPLSTARWAVVVVEPEEGTLATAGSLPRSIPTLLAGLLLMAAGFAWGAARSITRPVEQLGAEAEKIAAGRLDEPIPDLGQDEIGRLGRSLDRMRASLAESMAQVERANAGLERRVEARTRELNQAYQALREREEQRARLLRTVITAQEDERKRIARELHDETTQELAVLVMGLETALAALRSGGPSPRLDEVKALGVHILEGLHRLIQDLRPAVLDDLGLYSAVRWYAERQLRDRGVALRCELGPPPPARLAPEVEIALFRICQEALNNVVRHAGAESVLIQMEAVNGELRIEIEDDGKGFDAGGPGPADRPHYGLLGIRERAELLGGTARIDSAPGKGTRVEVRLPLPAAPPGGEPGGRGGTPLDGGSGAGENPPHGEGG